MNYVGLSDLVCHTFLAKLMIKHQELPASHCKLEGNP